MAISFRYPNVKSLNTFAPLVDDEIELQATVFYTSVEDAANHVLPIVKFYRDGKSYCGQARGMRTAFSSTTSYEACFKLLVRKLAIPPIYDNADVVIMQLTLK